MDIEAFETAQASGAPRVRQFSVFLEDRVGQLLRLTRLFETTDVRIVGLSMVYSVDCAIIRMVVDDPDQGYELISGSRFPVCETELLAVSIPHGRKGLLSIWTALLTAEINIRYAYPLFIRPRGQSKWTLKPLKRRKLVGHQGLGNFRCFSKTAWDNYFA